MSKEKGYTLTKEEETRLFLQIKAGKNVIEKIEKGEPLNEEEQLIFKEACKAKNTIFFATVDLIDIIFDKFFLGFQQIKDDARQNAAIRLMNCIDTFDLEKNIKFSSYASTAIKRAIADSFKGKSLCDKKGFNQNCRKVEKAIAEFQKIYGRDPTEEELIELVPIGKRAIRNVRTKNRSVSPMCELSSKRDTVDTTEELLDIRSEDQHYEDTVFEEVTKLCPGTYMYEQIKFQMQEILNKYCTEQEQMVIDYRFGFHGDPLLDEDIAKKLGITENEVKIIWAQAILKLEQPCKEYEMKDALE